MIVGSFDHIATETAHDHDLGQPWGAFIQAPGGARSARWRAKRPARARRADRPAAARTLAVGISVGL
jgi:hypothetical protein